MEERGHHCHSLSRSHAECGNQCQSKFLCDIDLPVADMADYDQGPFLNASYFQIAEQINTPLTTTVLVSGYNLLAAGCSGPFGMFHVPSPHPGTVMILTDHDSSLRLQPQIRQATRLPSLHAL